MVFPKDSLKETRVGAYREATDVAKQLQERIYGEMFSVLYSDSRRGAIYYVKVSSMGEETEGLLLRPFPQPGENSFPSMLVSRKGRVKIATNSDFDGTKTLRFTPAILDGDRIETLENVELELRSIGKRVYQDGVFAYPTLYENTYGDFAVSAMELGEISALGIDNAPAFDPASEEKLSALQRFRDFSDVALEGASFSATAPAYFHGLRFAGELAREAVKTRDIVHEGSESGGGGGGGGHGFGEGSN